MGERTLEEYSTVWGSTTQLERYCGWRRLDYNMLTNGGLQAGHVVLWFEEDARYGNTSAQRHGRLLLDFNHWTGRSLVIAGWHPGMFSQRAHDLRCTES